MKSLAKLKDEARRFEQDEAWSKAIGVYLRVLQQSDTGGAEIELPLYNRIGDLYVRLGEGETAVTYYEDAADRYAEAGLFNNAIALCNKALRYAPERVELLRKLGQFSASQGFLIDARAWYLQYAEKMFHQGDHDEAFGALEDFANLSDDPSTRELLGRRLHSHGRSPQAVEELKRAYAMRMAAGEAEEAESLRQEIYAIDPNAGELDAVVQQPRRRRAESFALPGLVDLADTEDRVAGGGSAGSSAAAGTVQTPDGGDVGTEGVDLGLDSGETLAGAAGRETQRMADFEAGEFEADDSVGIGGMEGLETTDLGGLPFVTDEAAELEAEAIELPGLDDSDAPSLDAGALDRLDLEAADDDDSGEDVDEPLPFLAMDGRTGGDDDLLDGLAVLEVPSAGEDVDESVARARVMAAEGRGEEAAEMLAALHARLHDSDDAAARVRVLDALVALRPDDVSAHQSRIEALTRAAATTRFVDAFLELAAALDRSGARQQARMVYQQVLDLDPANASALRALGRARPAAAGDYIDLGALLAEDDASDGDTTRFYVAEKEPTGDEDRDFAELLAQFKSKIAENVPAEDAGSHYDLGLAYKEMGLLDEAIGEFQVALRNGDQRLKIYEEIGRCFFAKGQHNVVVKVLGRALEGRRDDELELIGLFYFLGRAYEELGQRDAARDAYERVVALDVAFEDVPERLGRL